MTTIFKQRSIGKKIDQKGNQSRDCILVLSASQRRQKISTSGTPFCQILLLQEKRRSTTDCLLQSK